MLVFAAVVLSCHYKKEDGQPKPNVLFITVDDLRPTLGCYGDTKAISPNIDNLAANGVVFNRAYCQLAVCNPSRASVMTGLRPDQIGVTDLHRHFREKLPDVVTLPQLFIKNGYHAVGIGKIYHGSKRAQDSLSWTQPALFNLSVKANEYVLPENKTGEKEAAYEQAGLEDTGYEDGQITQQAIRQLQAFKESGKPFFLAVGFKKPHLPFAAPKKYWGLYEPSLFDTIPGKAKPAEAPEIAFHHSQELRGYNGIPEHGDLDVSKERNLWHGYYACVSFVDAQVGKIMQTLKVLELDQNTVVVLWGDHGYHLGEQELWCKSTNFELDTRIPLIISAPGQSKAGAQSNSIVEALDIYPTLADLCGLNPEGELAGISLKPVLKNPKAEVKEAAFSQFGRPYEALFAQSPDYMGYSVRTKNWRCTAWFNLQSDSIEYTELYLLENDKIEKQNHSGDNRFKETESELIRLLWHYKNRAYTTFKDKKINSF
jgi:iduronate 2-sulfatase